jgi:2-polyprenyl-6-methoxyphenol hydroxylase-like FAD-dependent oxidoreductase
MKVLISGGGIAGPALCFHLAKLGHQVTVFERHPAPLISGQNVDITGSALTVIKRMGLLEEVKKHNTSEKGTQFIDAHGRPFAPFPVKEGTTASFTSEYEILRGDLAKILYEATKGFSNVTYRFATTIQEVISNDEAGVKVRVGGEVEEYDLLVVSDGQWSKVRKQCFPEDAVNVVDKNMFVAYFTVPRTPADNDFWNIYQALGSKVVTTRPDPYGTIRAMFSLMPCNEQQKTEWMKAARSDRQSQEDILRKEFTHSGWESKRFLDEMSSTEDFYFHAIQQIRMKTWSTGRVVCLGDTAYAPTPLTGMGTSLALTGAYVLAGELSKQETTPTKAFQAYESTFKPFVDNIQNIPFFVPAIAHPQTAFKRWLLHTFVWTLSIIVPKILSIPYFAKKAATENDDDFPLPSYPVLEAAEGVKTE